MSRYYLLTSLSFLAAALLTPLAQALARRWGFLDRPGGRKSHAHPIPLLGGGAIYLAIVAALLAAGRPFLRQTAALLTGATLVALLGLVDDRRALSPGLKFGGQTVAAALVLWSGIRVQIFPWTALNVFVTLLWIVGVTNAFNLLDNMDGLSAGTAAICAAFFLLLAAGSGQFLVGALSAALLGASLGFLLYNFNPAQIFMGDAGSLLIGFLLAVIGIKLRFPNLPTRVSWLLPVLVLGVPLFDTALVTISRLRRGRSPFLGGQDHLSHRLLLLGLSRREAVLVLYLASGALGVLALFLHLSSPREALGLTLVLGFLAVGALAFFEALYRRHASSREG